MGRPLEPNASLIAWFHFFYLRQHMLLFFFVRVSVCLSAKKRKILIRNWCNLVGICVMVLHKGDYASLIIWPCELKMMAAHRFVHARCDKMSYALCRYPVGWRQETPLVGCILWRLGLCWAKENGLTSYVELGATVTVISSQAIPLVNYETWQLPVDYYNYYT